MLPLFAVNIYVLFCDIISKYFPILLNSLTREGERKAASGSQMSKVVGKVLADFCVDESNGVLRKL